MFGAYKLFGNLIKKQVFIQGNRLAKFCIIGKLPNDAEAASRWTTLNPTVHLGYYS